MRIIDGNVNEAGHASKGPGKSSLFSLTYYDPEIGLSGARVKCRAKHNTFVVSGASLIVRENPAERISLSPGRTHNRSRSPR
jgi:hypothetical protein